LFDEANRKVDWTRGRYPAPPP